MTLLAYFVSDTASSSAELPPPATKISLSVKKSPSQVAQYEIPFPLNVSSPGTPNVLGLPPGVRIILSEEYLLPSDNDTVFITASRSREITDVFD